MLGKITGAWLGNRIAGKNEGAKGAVIGYGAAALARRSLPALAAVALGGWALKKWRKRRRSVADHSSGSSAASDSSVKSSK
jgi:hypothetical protein